MPTEAEINDLINQCTWTWTTKNGITGYEVTSTVNSNSIFLPSAGGITGDSLLNVGISGYFCSSSRSPNHSTEVWYVKYSQDNVYLGFALRCYGYTVRPVTE